MGRLLFLIAIIAATSTAQWLPNSVPPPLMWVRADANVVFSGSAVTAWNDIRGTSAGFDVANSGNNVVYNSVSASLSNKPAIQFQAGKTLVARTYLNTAMWWVFAVSRLTGGSNRRLVTAVYPADANWLLGNWEGYEDMFYFNNYLYWPSIAATTQPRLYTAGQHTSGTWGYKNGNLLFTSPTYGSPPGRLQLGGLGPGYNGELTYGEVAEIIAFNMELTDQQVKSVHCYLAGRYSSSGFSSVGCTSYCCPETVATCAFIDSKCVQFAERQVGFTEACLDNPGSYFCTVQAAMTTLISSCNREHSSCVALLATC